MFKKKAKIYKKKIRAILSRIDKKRLIHVDKNSLTVAKYLPNYRNIDWHVAFGSINGISSPDYLPEDIYYTKIEPALNSSSYGEVYSDKSCLGFLIDRNDYIGNDFFFNRGRFYDGEGNVCDMALVEKWIMKQGDIVLKPSKISGGGRNFIIGKKDIILERIRNERKSYVIQKAFVQHPDLKKIHKESINSIRVITLRNNGRIFMIGAYLRTGVGGSRIDNVTRGGLHCGINEGFLGEYAYDRYQNAFKRHPDSQIAFEGLKIPNWRKAHDIVIKNHKKITELDLLSWDIAIDQDGCPKVIEINCFEQTINSVQISSGPVFGPHLECMLQRP